MMTEAIAFIAGVVAGLIGAGPAKQWALSKLNKAQPVMGGPIQPDEVEGWAFAVGDTVQVIATGSTGPVVDREESLIGVRLYRVRLDDGLFWYAEDYLAAI